MRLRLLSLTALAFGCAATLAATPNITGVVNAANWLPADLPNSGVAQGAIFTVTGTGLGPSTLLEAFTYPLPTAAGLGGTTITVTAGDVAVFGIMIYTSATQVAAILPSSTPVGTAILKLSYQGGNSSFAIQIVAANFGTLTLNEGGTGPAVVTEPSYTPITMINPAHPGDTLILWGFGLGPATGDETEPPTQADLHTGVQVLVGNQPATVTYGGRGSSPGLDQINFVVPAGVTGCKTSIAVLLKGVTGNVTTTSIAPEGQTTCGDTFNGLTAANLQKAISTGSLSIACVELNRTVGEPDTLFAAFGSFPLSSLIRSYGGTTSPSLGSCLSYETYGAKLVVTDPIHATPLPTGPQLTITGPSGSKAVDEFSVGIYAGTLATASPFFIAPGNFTATNGSGGSDVAGFNWNLTLPASVVPTNMPTSIHRAQDLTLTWTGGSDYSVVSVFGYSAVPKTLTSTQFSWVQFLCTADASAGTFTIPSAILNLLPTNGFGGLFEPGASIQIAGLAESQFTGANSPGLDEGFFTAFISSGAVVNVE